jgi:hypothetical protein
LSALKPEPSDRPERHGSVSGTAYPGRSNDGRREAWRRADLGRAYVAAVRDALAMSGDARLGAWTDWALREADRIDPIVAGTARQAVESFEGG